MPSNNSALQEAINLAKNATSSVGRTFSNFASKAGNVLDAFRADYANYNLRQQEKAKQQQQAFKNFVSDAGKTLYTSKIYQNNPVRDFVVNPQNKLRLLVAKSGEIPVTTGAGFLQYSPPEETNEQFQQRLKTPIKLKEFFQPKSYAGGTVGKALASDITNVLGGFGMGLPQAGQIAQLAPRAGVNALNIIKGMGVGGGIPVATSYLAGEKQNPANIIFGTVLGGYFGALAPEPLPTKSQLKNIVVQENLAKAKAILTKNGITSFTDPVKLKSEYRNFAWKNHPDLGGNKQAMAEINDAFYMVTSAKPPLINLAGLTNWISNLWTKKATRPDGSAIVPYIGQTTFKSPMLPSQTEGNLSQAGTTEPFEIGITSFRGTPVKTVAETEPYFSTPRAVGFSNSLQTKAPTYNLQINGFQKSAGVWEGSIEPSFAVNLNGKVSDGYAYAAEHGMKANQDAVVIFIPAKGTSSRWELPNISNPDTAIQEMNNMGISGGTIKGNSLIVYDVDGSLKKSIISLGEKLNVIPIETKGKVDFLEKTNYSKYIQQGRTGGNGNYVPTDLQTQQTAQTSAQIKVKEPSKPSVVDISKPLNGDGGATPPNQPTDITRQQEMEFNKDFAVLYGKLMGTQTEGLIQAKEFAKIPLKLAPDVIKLRETPNATTVVVNGKMRPINPEAKQYIAPIAQKYDDLHAYSQTQGIDMGYLENYITHYWKAPLNVVRANYLKFKLKNNIFNNRKYPTYEEGEAMGEKREFVHPAQIVNQYVIDIERAIAFTEFFANQKAKGIFVTPEVGRQLGYVPVSALGVPKLTIPTTDVTGQEVKVQVDYYAPPKIAAFVNKVASPQGAFSNAEKFFAKTGAFSSMWQDLILSGGIPYTPINAFTFGQIYLRMARGAGALARLNIPFGVKTIISPFAAVIRSMIPGVSQKYFKENINIIKEIQEQNIPLKTSYSLDQIIDRGFFEKLLGIGTGRGTWGTIKSAWFKAITDATFQKFMPMVQIDLYKAIKAESIRKSINPVEAQKIAGDALKMGDGLIKGSDKATRNRLFQDIVRTFLFAPTYRESMINIWVNAIKSASPIHITTETGKFGIKLNNPFSTKNKPSFDLLIGSILVLLLSNYVNKALNNGRDMKDNPPGMEDKVLIPLQDGTVIGMPFFPSTLTIPRALYRATNELISGDIAGATTQIMSSVPSVWISPLSGIASNENYFGQQIYDDNDSSKLKAEKIGLYLVGRYNHPWIQAAIAKFGDKNVPTYQALLMALESPLRFYTVKSINSKYYYGNVDEQRRTLDPKEQQIWDLLHKTASFDAEDGLPIYDTRGPMANALLRLAYPNLVIAEQEVAIQTSLQTNQPLNPFYTLTPDQQLTALMLKTYYPGDPQKKTVQNANMEWLQPYWDKVGEYVDQMKQLGIFQDVSTKVPTTVTNASQLQKKLDSYNKLPEDSKDTYLIKNPDLKDYLAGNELNTLVWTQIGDGVVDSNQILNRINFDDMGNQINNYTLQDINDQLAKPPISITPSARLQAKLDYYNTLPQGTGARSSFIRGNPDVKNYFDFLRQQTNDKRAELGLPPLPDYGGSSWGSAPANPKIKVPKAKAVTKMKLVAKSAIKPLKLKTKKSKVASMPKFKTKTYKLAKLKTAPFKGLPQTIGGLGKIT